MYLVSSFISAVLQVVIFSLIPFLVYIISRKKISGFFEYVGLHKVKGTWIKNTLLIGIGVLVIGLIPFAYYNYSGSFESELLSANNFTNSNFGVPLLLEIFIYAFIQTSLSEEILFRGFIAKRLIGKLGFVKGNIIQSVIFGLVHGMVFYSYGPIAVLLSVMMPTITGYIFAWHNEKNCNGSIFGSWLMHAISNVIAPIIIIFLF